MEAPPSSKRVATVRRDGDWKSTRDGIGVDGEREHQPVFGVQTLLQSAGACTFLAQDPYFRLSLMVA